MPTTFTQAFARLGRSRAAKPLLIAKVGAAVALGPLTSYLVWAVLKRRPVHIAIAAALNVALWTVTPALIAHSAGVL